MSRTSIAIVAVTAAGAEDARVVEAVVIVADATDVAEAGDGMAEAMEDTAVRDGRASFDILKPRRESRLFHLLQRNAHVVDCE